MDTKTHWEEVYATKPADEVSWFQERSETSLALIQSTGISKSASIIDVGGGASRLVDDLLADGFQNVTVLDIAATALHVAQERLGSRAASVTWLDDDITEAALPERYFDLWHDRAVFHFLTDPDDRRKYVAQVSRSVRPGGHVIVAAFAPDGPLRCSGMDVVRYSPDTLHGEFGDGFQFIAQRRETHKTPFGTEQQFVYCCCRRM